MKTSSKGVEMIKLFEHFMPRIYICPAGLKTIGYGHVLKPHENFTSLSQEQSEELLKKDLLTYECVINSYNKPLLKQNQFDALVSLAFNIGVGAFLSSTLFKYLQKFDYRRASEQFLRWVYCKGKVMPGLIRRRRVERRLFLDR